MRSRVVFLGQERRDTHEHSQQDIFTVAREPQHHSTSESSRLRDSEPAYASVVFGRRDGHAITRCHEELQQRHISARLKGLFADCLSFFLFGLCVFCCLISSARERRNDPSPAPLRSSLPPSLLPDVHNPPPSLSLHLPYPFDNRPFLREQCPLLYGGLRCGLPFSYAFTCAVSAGSSPIILRGWGTSGSSHSAGVRFLSTLCCSGAQVCVPLYWELCIADRVVGLQPLVRRYSQHPQMFLRSEASPDLVRPAALLPLFILSIV